MFKINPLYLSDGYKVGHKAMLAPGTTRLYGTWIPRSLKHAPKGVTKIVSFGQQLVWRYIHDAFKENFFDKRWKEVDGFARDMSNYLGMDFDGSHFKELHELGYLPICVKSLPEGVETNPNVPHMTFINTVDGYAWLTLYLETLVSSLAWKLSTSATIAKQYRTNLTEWIAKTDRGVEFLIDYLCHDFSARGLSPHDAISSGLGHATQFRGSDTLAVIPAARYYYDESEENTVINSVNASEHSVSTTKIFTVGEQQMLSDWMKVFPEGILSIVADTFDLWKLITEYLPAVRDEIMARDGKIVIRPDSGDPVDIICGFDNWTKSDYGYFKLRVTNNETFNQQVTEVECKGVIELLWDIFGGTINDQGYKVLDPHIGAIYGDSITLERQVQIYERLEAKGFAASNIVLGIGSFTYQYNTRDTFGWAAKGAWFEVEGKTEQAGENVWVSKKGYDIFKDPVTDDGTKKSLKGLIAVRKDDKGEYQVHEQQDWAGEAESELEEIYRDGKFYNQTTLTKIREKLK